MCHDTHTKKAALKWSRKKEREEEERNWIRNFVMNSNFISCRHKKSWTWLTDYFIFLHYSLSSILLLARSLLVLDLEIQFFSSPSWSALSSWEAAIWDNIICICIAFTAKRGWMMLMDYKLPCGWIHALLHPMDDDNNMLGIMCQKHVLIDD